MKTIMTTVDEIVGLDTKDMFWTMSVKGDVCVFVVYAFIFDFSQFNEFLILIYIYIYIYIYILLYIYIYYYINI